MVGARGKWWVVDVSGRHRGKLVGRGKKVVGSRVEVVGRGKSGGGVAEWLAPTRGEW